LNSPTFVLPTIAFVSAWWLCGYRMVVFRAGLNAIPRELYESSSSMAPSHPAILRHNLSR